MIKLTEEERLKERTEGRQENTLEIAKAMLKKGFSLNDISEITGLSFEKIKQL